MSAIMYDAFSKKVLDEGVDFMNTSYFHVYLLKGRYTPDYINHVDVTAIEQYVLASRRLSTVSWTGGWLDAMDVTFEYSLSREELLSFNGFVITCEPENSPTLLLCYSPLNYIGKPKLGLSVSLFEVDVSPVMVVEVSCVWDAKGIVNLFPVV